MSTNTSQRTGAVLPMIAVFIAAFLFVAALTINSNWFMFNHTNAQNTADISARASLQKILSDTDANGRFDRARDLGVRLYDLNLARDVEEFDAQRIRFGNVINSSIDDPSFVESLNEDDLVSAVHVDSPLQVEHQQVEVFFNELLGADKHIKIYADAKASSRPVDIMLCLDASRSMNKRSGSNGFPPGATTIHQPPMPASRWFELKDTVAVFLQAMKETNPNARVGLVTFGGGLGLPAARASSASPLDDDWSRFEKELTVVIASDIVDITNTMESYATDYPALGYGTSLYDGIETSIASFSQNDQSSKHIVMLSDGEQVADGRSEPSVAAQNAADKGIKIHTIAFGRSLTVMENIAADTGGSTFAAVSEAELREAFAQLLGRFRVQLVD